MSAPPHEASSRGQDCLRHRWDDSVDERPDQLDALDAAARVRRVIAEVVMRRGRGEVVPDADVMGAHPELMPQLGEELDCLRMVRRTMLAALRAGPAQEPP